MKKITAGQAKARLEDLIDQVAITHKPIRIIGKRVNEILIGKEDWVILQKKIHSEPPLELTI